jgi:DNA-binding transcriptional LysR family regulator
VTTVARLRALVTVADAGSVREAARRLTVTESAVSAALSALAREVRVPLVERDGRGLRLTASGQAYSVYARAILGLHEEGLATVRGDRDPERGRVRVAAVSTAGEYLLPTALAAFIAHHPAVDLRLEVGSSERSWRLFAAHEADLVIGGRPPGHVGDAVVRAVRPNLLVVVAAPEVAAGFDISRTTWLQREVGSGTRATGEALLSGLDADPPRPTLASRDAVSRQLQHGELVEVAVPGTPLRRPWNAVTHDRQPGATALLVRHLLDREGWRTPRAGTTARSA